MLSAFQIRFATLPRLIQLAVFAFVVSLSMALVHNVPTAHAASFSNVGDDNCTFAYSSDKKTIHGECTAVAGGGLMFSADWTAKFSDGKQVYTGTTSGESTLNSATCNSTIEADPKKASSGKISGELLNVAFSRAGGSYNCTSGSYDSLVIEVSSSNTAALASASLKGIQKSTAAAAKKYCESQPVYRKETPCLDAWNTVLKACHQSTWAAMQILILEEKVTGTNKYGAINNLTKEGRDKYRSQMIACITANGGRYFSDAATVRNILTDAAVTAMNNDVKDTAIDVVNDTSSSKGEGTSCAIDGIGWIVCPVMGFMAGVVDGMYSVVSTLLTVTPLTTDTSKSGLYSAWSIMRNLANVAFVIAFLIIVYSQLTGGGITNYGIKKMLPRLVVSAILVNVSFWISAIAVDISNIAGTSLKSLFDTIGGSIEVPSFGNGATGESGWQSIVGPILAGTVAVTSIYIGIGGLLVALPAALLAIITAFLVLTLRQALIIILVVISPLAFVAYLLPNTADWFKRWRETFQTMLLMYPIIAVVFGGSAFASKVIMSSAANADGDGKLFVQLMGALVAILPLAITPIIMKFAGGILNRFGGIVNNPNRGPFDALRKRMEGTRDRINNNRDMRALARGADGTYERGFSMRRGGLRRQSKLDDIKKQRDATYENFGNTDKRTSRITGNETGAAVTRAKAISAQETAQKSGEILQNETKLKHLEANGQLHTDAINSGLNLKNTEETHRAKAEEAHQVVNPGQYDALNEARGALKNQQLDTERRFEGSTEGMNQAVGRQGIEEDLKIIRGEQGNVYKGSAQGRGQAQRTREVQATTKRIDTTADVAYEQSGTGQAQSTSQQAVEGELEIARGENKNEFNASAAGQAQATAKDAVSTEGKTIDLRNEAATLEANRDLKLEEQLRSDELEAAKAEEGALVQELRTEEGAAQNPQYGVVAEGLRAADTTKRAQSQRTASASTKATSEYATAVKADDIIPGGTETLATVAGGVRGAAGVLQAKAVAHQTMLDDWRKTVEANETLLSEVKEGELLGDPDSKGVVRSDNLNNPNALDLPDEELSAMASHIAKRRHMKSHIRLWKRLGELHKQASKEVATATTPEQTKAAEERLSKVKNMQQIVMANKTKTPFGFSDQNQGDATSGDYDDNIFENSRKRIMSNFSPESMASADPDDFNLWYEMDRKGFLTPEQRAKLVKVWDDWQASDQFKDKIQDKHRNVMDRIKNHATTGTWNTSLIDGLPDPGFNFDLTAADFT